MPEESSVQRLALWECWLTPKTSAILNGDRKSDHSIHLRELFSGRLSWMQALEAKVGSADELAKALEDPAAVASFYEAKQSVTLPKRFGKGFLTR